MARTNPDPACPVACALAQIGEKWTLLILRDLTMHPSRRFQDFIESLKGCAPNTLSARLSSLARRAHGWRGRRRRLRRQSASTKRRDTAPSGVVSRTKYTPARAPGDQAIACGPASRRPSSGDATARPCVSNTVSRAWPARPSTMSKRIVSRPGFGDTAIRNTGPTPGAEPTDACASTRIAP